jgi:hypothetical protein
MELQIQFTVHAPDAASAARMLCDALGGATPAAPADQAGVSPVDLAVTVPGPAAHDETFTAERLAVAASKLVDQGRGEALRCVLRGRFGAQCLTALEACQLAEMAAEIQKLGGKL